MRIHNGLIVLLLILIVAITACGKASHETTGSNSSLLNINNNGSTAGLTGAQVFEQRCAGCHGSVAAMGPRTAAQITTAFGAFPQMAGVAAITNAEEIQAIADALNGITTVVGGSPSGPVPLTGAQLYMVNCQGCHGITPPADSRTAGGILSAINGVAEMASLSSLSPADRQSIAQYVSANLQVSNGEFEED